MSPWFGMILISFLTALLMLLVYRFTSNQQGIKQVKNKIKAHLLELWLFRDSLRLTLKAQGNILRHNLKYIGYASKPLLMMIIPLILILSQLNLWFGYQALDPGEKTILKVKLKESQSLLDINLSVEPSSGFDIETLPIRIEEEGEISWRLHAKEMGVHDLSLIIDGTRITKEIAVSQKPLSRISQAKVRRNLVDEFFHPKEAPLPGNLPIKKIEVKYPSKSMNFFGWRLPWWLVYLALAILFGFTFKGVFKVEI